MPIPALVFATVTGCLSLPAIPSGYRGSGQTDRPATIELSKGPFVITGQVVTASGVVPTGLTIAIGFEEEGLRGSEFASPQPADGRFRIGRLAGGTYVLEAKLDYGSLASSSRLIGAASLDRLAPDRVQ